MYEVYARLDQEKLGRIIIAVSSSLAGLLFIAAIIYATGTGGRSAAALAAAGCEPGSSSENAPCTTEQELDRQYLAVMTPAGQQIAIDQAAYAGSEMRHLVTAEAALTAEVSTGQALARDLAAIKFPPAITPAAAALIEAERARAGLIAAQRQASSLTQLRSFDRRVQAADGAVSRDMKLLLAAVQSPARAG